MRISAEACELSYCLRFYVVRNEKPNIQRIRKTYIINIMFVIKPIFMFILYISLYYIILYIFYIIYIYIFVISKTQNISNLPFSISSFFFATEKINTHYNTHIDTYTDIYIYKICISLCVNMHVQMTCIQSSYPHKLYLHLYP